MTKSLKFMRKIAILAVLGGFLSFGIAKASFDVNIRYGTKNSDAVKEVQEFLTDQGVYSGPITGNFYTLTLKAVKMFQKVQGLAINGYWGPETRSKALDLTKEDDQAANQASFNQENIPLSNNEPAFSFGDGKTYNFNGKALENNAISVTPSTPVIDWCNNILGSQSILPPGYIRSEDNNCYPKPIEVVQVPVVSTSTISSTPIVEATPTITPVPTSPTPIRQSINCVISNGSISCSNNTTSTSFTLTKLSFSIYLVKTSLPETTLRITETGSYGDYHASQTFKFNSSNPYAYAGIDRQIYTYPLYIPLELKPGESKSVKINWSIDFLLKVDDGQYPVTGIIELGGKEYDTNYLSNIKF